MIRIIDNTLTGFDGILPSKEDLLEFCDLLITIGVDMIEMSIDVYEKLGEIPEKGNYVLHIDFFDEINQYPGFYRYTCHQEENQEKMIHEVQMNDVREIIKLRSFYGCKEIRIVGLDDLMCGSYDKSLGEIRKMLPKSKINFCPENTYNCASALAVSWAIDYGSDVTTSFAGWKNNAATEEVLMALRIAVRHKPNRDLTVLPKLVKLYEKITDTKIGNKKPVIGKNIFKVEAGIHADGLKKNPATYEAYEPGCVGCKSELVIGKHSGMRAIKAKMEELGLNLPDDVMIEKILQQVKVICTESRKSLDDDEFISLVSEVITNERV
jgi:homocitrate synthase NifV